MTLDEAKQIFLDRGFVNGVFDGNKWRESVIVISKWLKKEPCEDAVSRQAVLSYIYNDLGLGDEENGEDVERQMELERSYKYVKSLPSVTPQPKAEQKDGDLISKSVLDQIKWERDIAISQLHDLGYELGEKPRTDGDLIRRQAVIDEIEYEIEMVNSALDSMTLDFNARERIRQRKGEAREILNSIQQLPSVTPQPSAEKTAEWITKWDEEKREERHYCINCNDYQLFQTKFCPNCGAKMEENGRIK